VPEKKKDIVKFTIPAPFIVTEDNPQVGVPVLVMLIVVEISGAKTIAVVPERFVTFHATEFLKVTVLPFQVQDVPVIVKDPD
jgi:hypothetical protein